MCRKKKILAALLSAVLALSFCSCAQTKPSSSEEQSSSAASESSIISSAASESSASSAASSEASVTESASSSASEDIAVSTEQLQSLYGKAPEYDYMALGYYVSGFDDSGMLRDGYVPYNENFTQKESGALESSAHGVKIRLSMKKAASASEALDLLSADYSARLEAEGLTYVAGGDVTTADNDTVGFLQGAYQNEAGQIVYVLLYSDIRDDGSVYMCGEIELSESDFDDSTKALVAEVDDVYALTLSNLEMISLL